MGPAPLQKYLNLKDRLASFPWVVVAFSGGVDSLLLLHAATKALGPDQVEAVIGIAPTLPKRELEEARAFAADLGVRLHELDTGVMAEKEFLSNPVERCYHCRVNLTEVLTQMKHETEGRVGGSAGERGSAILLDGANADDLADYRPGLRAASEGGVLHPLIEAGITKQDVRELLRELGYPEAVCMKPAAPCLSSRVPYGEPITHKKLGRIEQAEGFLQTLGFSGMRVRHLETSLGDTAIIELPADQFSAGSEEEIRRKISTMFRELGFARILLDLEGFRSGGMNDVLQNADEGGP
jgi:pyridinium-3,5-biscarboxylic acid mononucleotide sulfurtransferase